MENTPFNIRLKEGNSAAFEELFKQTFPRLLGYCRLFIHDQAQANDLVQDCFLRLWEKRQTIDPRQSVESLLFVMLRNRCLNHLRDQKSDLIEKKIGVLEENELQHLYQLDFTGREEKSLEEQFQAWQHHRINHANQRRHARRGCRPAQQTRIAGQLKIG